MSPRNRIKSLISRPDSVGRLLRLALLFLLMAVVTVLSAVVQSIVNDSPIGPPHLLIVCLAIGIPMLMGLVASEIPAGEEFFLLRFAGATFCRTGLPLLAILMLSYSRAALVDQAVIMVVAVYAAGFGASVWLSVLRLHQADDPKNLKEVHSVTS